MMRNTERSQAARPEVHQLPDNGAGIVFEEYLLRRAVRDRLEAERRLSDAIALAAEAGFSWSAIGRMLGVGPQEADDGQDLEQAS